MWIVELMAIVDAADVSVTNGSAFGSQTPVAADLFALEAAMATHSEGDFDTIPAVVAAVALYARSF